MKTIKSTIFMALLFAAFTFSGEAYGQKLNKINVTSLKDCIIKQDGKVYQLKDGQLEKLKKSVVLSNGTKVKRNGVCIMPDKSRVRMREGNCIDPKGVIADCATLTKDKTVTAN